MNAGNFINRIDKMILLTLGALAVTFVMLIVHWYLDFYSGNIADRSSFLNQATLVGGMVAVLFCILVGAFITYPAARRGVIENNQMNKKTQSLQKQATTDALTGMNNRRYFEDALDDYLREFNAAGSTLGLLIMDLDHFKSVNDNYGHDVGDQVLKEVALRMRAISREHDVVARLGGEEFAVLTPFASREQLLSVAERYREMVEALHVSVGNVIVRPTVSIGVATNENHVTNPDDLFKAADKKLYEAKNSGRNRVAA